MTDSLPGSAPLGARVAELATDPDALRWAYQCGWVPGTGYCRNRDCGSGCLLRPQCEAEANRILRLRRQRRRAQRAGRIVPG